MAEKTTEMNVDMNQLVGQQPSKPAVNPFLDPKVIEHWNLMFTIAHHLEAEAAQYPKNQQLRINKLLTNVDTDPYNVLFDNCNVLFMEAINGTLKTGQMADMIKRYADGNGDPERIFKNLTGWAPSIIEPGLEKLKKMKEQEDMIKMMAEEMAEKNAANRGSVKFEGRKYPDDEE